MILAGGPTPRIKRQLEYERWIAVPGEGFAPDVVRQAWAHAVVVCDGLGVTPRAMLGGHKPHTKAARGEVFFRLFTSGFTLAQIEDGMRWGKILISRGG